MALQVESSIKAPRQSRSHLSSMKPALEPRYDDVLLLVSELVTNSVRHSHTRNIEVRVLTQDSQIRVEVSDEGPGFTTDTPRGDGLGLSIVEKLANRWGTADGDRFTVWAELDRSRA